MRHESIGEMDLAGKSNPYSTPANVPSHARDRRRSIILLMLLGLLFGSVLVIGLLVLGYYQSSGPPNAEVEWSLSETVVVMPLDDSYDWPLQKEVDRFSRTRGGSHVLMDDGAIVFLSDEVERTDSENEAELGMWSPLGTADTNAAN